MNFDLYRMIYSSAAKKHLRIYTDSELNKGSNVQALEENA
jgi:hypothetical protein